MSKCDPSLALSADVVYLAPSGRRCRWVPLGGDQRQVSAWSFFEYLPDGHGRRHGSAAKWAEGFCLSPANYRLLRRLPT